MRELYAYFRIQAEDRAHEQWTTKMKELHDKKKKAERGRMTGSLNVPQSRPSSS